MAVGIVLLSRMTTETSYAEAVVNIVVTGLGLGITLPLYTIVVQNAVPHNVLGVATSLVAFLRSLGGSVGLALFGSVMNNRFASEFTSGLPSIVKSLMPPDQLASLARNPQALVNPEAQAQLRGIFEQLGPQGPAIFDQIIQSLRHALASAVSEVFLIGFVITLIALAIHFFIKEIPLRKQNIPIDSK